MVIKCDDSMEHFKIPIIFLNTLNYLELQRLIYMGRVASSTRKLNIRTWKCGNTVYCTLTNIFIRLQDKTSSLNSCMHITLCAGGSKRRKGISNESFKIHQRTVVSTHTTIFSDIWKTVSVTMLKTNSVSAKKMINTELNF